MTSCCFIACDHKLHSAKNFQKLVICENYSIESTPKDGTQLEREICFNLNLKQTNNGLAKKL